MNRKALTLTDAKGRKKTAVVKWMTKSRCSDYKAAAGMGFSLTYFRRKKDDDIFTLKDFVLLAPLCGYTLALIDNQTEDVYDLGAYLKGEIEK